jgi:hypothetical protein
MGQAKSPGRVMKNIFNSVGISLWRKFFLILSAPFLIVKMSITDAKEEASDIERASKG